MDATGESHSQGVGAGMKWRQHLESLDEDIRDHLERETQINIDRGIPPP
jgi:hypothetical protein